MFAIFREIISNVILERFWPHVRVNWALSTETLDIPAGNRPYIFWTVARLYIPRSYIWSTYTGNSIIQGTECLFRFFVPFFSFSWSKSSWLSFFFSFLVCNPADCQMLFVVLIDSISRLPATIARPGGIHANFGGSQHWKTKTRVNKSSHGDSKYVLFIKVFVFSWQWCKIIVGKKSAQCITNLSCQTTNLIAWSSHNYPTTSLTTAWQLFCPLH